LRAEGALHFHSRDLCLDCVKGIVQLFQTNSFLFCLSRFFPVSLSGLSPGNY
jgi:hypothetical protein